jgi:hypothetical protein
MASSSLVAQGLPSSFIFNEFIKIAAPQSIDIGRKPFLGTTACCGFGYRFKGHGLMDWRS